MNEHIISNTKDMERMGRNHEAKSYSIKSSRAGEIGMYVQEMGENGVRGIGGSRWAKRVGRPGSVRTKSHGLRQDACSHMVCYPVLTDV
jgi:hypothetical protein